MESRKDFIDFLKSLKEGFVEESNSWSNNNLKDYLRGLIMITEDCDLEKAEFDIKDVETPSWELFAELMYSAIHYDYNERKIVRE